jgi:hypothetical protein
MQFRRTPIRVTLARGELTVVADAEGFSRPVRVGVDDEVRELRAGDRWAGGRRLLVQERRAVPATIRLDTFAQEQGLTSQSIRPGLSLLEFFDGDVSGRDFARGKPHPEMFLTAAQELATAPEQSFVIEDAGVQAAKAGDMAALALARADDAELLAAAGADLVVTSLDDVDLAALSDGRLAKKGN